MDESEVAQFGSSFWITLQASAFGFAYNCLYFSLEVDPRYQNLYARATSAT